MNFPVELAQIVDEQPQPLLFVTVSGAHLYGFPSPDSDFDLRGAHVLGLSEISGLAINQETIELSTTRNDLQIDLVSHDVRKFFLMLLKRNGYVLEQLYSPLVVHSTPEHAELKAIAAGCITRHHAHHYLGFASNQWRIFENESPRRVKTLLYIYRVLLTGIHLMRTGRIEANVLTLADEFGLSFVQTLVHYKLAAPELASVPHDDLSFHGTMYRRLRDELESAHASSHLPNEPGSRAALNDFLIRVRFALPTA